MKNFIRLQLFTIVCAASMLSVPVSAMNHQILSDGQVLMRYNAATGRVIDGFSRSWELVPAEKTSCDKFMDGAVSTAKYGAVAALALTIGSQYRIVKECGWKTLFVHKDSWPMFVWDLGCDLASAAKYVGAVAYKGVKKGSQAAGNAVCSTAKKGASAVGNAVCSTAKKGALAAKVATCNHVKSACGSVKSFAHNLNVRHHDACLVAGTLAVIAVAAYTTKRLYAFSVKSSEKTELISPEEVFEESQPSDQPVILSSGCSN